MVNAGDATTDLNRRCARCGAAVSSRFIRVFGVDNTVHGCLECTQRADLTLGRAAEPSTREAGISWPVGEPR
ncbi:hypothetical protein DVK07_14610 [Halorubrum sp. Atlit-26R]|nr:hypothetical protein DVK07_14610 [Halorubrum sp. Atlit-26R]